MKGKEDEETREVPKLRAKGYMDKFINPPDFMEKQKQRMEKDKAQEKKFPERPERDVLLFLTRARAARALGARRPRDHPRRGLLLRAAGDDQDHERGLGHLLALEDHDGARAQAPSEIIDYADHASGVTASAPGQLNPYKLGVELYRHIEERWDKGQFGKEWDECTDMAARKSWDRRLGLGKKKIFEVRKLYNDITFVDEFFTEEFCRGNKFFSFGFNERSGNWEIESREFKKVKDKLLFRLTNFGQPFIYVEDGNFENRGELMLKHKHEGVDLKMDHARDTLEALARVWKRPVNILTRVDGKGKLMRFDGRDHSEKGADYPDR